MLGVSSEPEGSAPVFVIGATTTAVRLVDELERAGERAIAVVPQSGAAEAEGEATQGWVLDELAESGAEVHTVPVVRESRLVELGIARARAAVVVGMPDVTSLRLALALEELAPQARVVLELANPELGARLGQVLPQVAVLSSAQLAAPSFVSAALSDGSVTSFEIAGRQVVAGRREAVGGEVLAVLGDSQNPELSGALGEAGDVVLGTELVRTQTRPVRQSGWFGAIAHVFDARLRWVVAILLVLVLLSTVYFHVVGSMDWLMALYVALTASTLTGIGDVDQLSLGARFGGVVIQLFGLILSSGITAVIVDALISSRLAAMTGGVRGRPRDHVVVAGLGRVGREVALRLHERGVPVVGLEVSEDSAGVLACRAAKIPVVVGEATDRTALHEAGVDRARAVMAITDNDAVNLEIALVAKEANPRTRVVTRLFDHELAQRVEQRVNLGPTRSVSLLSAPAFAAAALGRRREQIVSIGRRVLIFTELTIQHGSVAARGVNTSALDQVDGVLVLAHQRGEDAQWCWGGPNVRLVEGDRVAVAATRHGLAQVLRTVKTPGMARPAPIVDRDDTRAGRQG